MADFVGLWSLPTAASSSPDVPKNAIMLVFHPSHFSSEPEKCLTGTEGSLMRLMRPLSSACSASGRSSIDLRLDGVVIACRVESIDSLASEVRPSRIGLRAELGFGIRAFLSDSASDSSASGFDSMNRINRTSLRR
eukprot:2458713-Prorocentrum_lima.AAC.1